MPQQNFSLGRTNEITRDEVKFNKFVERLRKKFSHVFRDALRVQLIAKGIIRPDEWDDMAYHIRFDFQRDNHFSEMKEAELINNRAATLQNLDPFVGKYYSMAWIRKHVLQLTEDDIEEIEKEIEDERDTLEDFNLMGQPDKQAAKQEMMAGNKPGDKE